MKKARIALIALVFALGVYAPRVSAQVTTISACQNITVAGSYELNKNLTSTGGNCLVILVSHVTINLNGFTISSTVHTGAAITDLAAARAVITIEHGALYAFKTGIDLAASNTIEIVDVRTINMGGDGIDGGQHTDVSASQSIGNGLNGISLGNDSSVTGSTANANTGGNGISMGSQARVTGNTANTNGKTGIVTLIRSLVGQNQTSSNKSDGISVGVSSIVTGNTSDGNTIYGIEAAGYDLVENNVTDYNTTGIFFLGGGSSEISNVAYGNSKDGIDNGTFAEATLINNNASHNGGTGITVTCPSNLVADTALGNGTNFSPPLGAPGCGNSNNL